MLLHLPSRLFLILGLLWISPSHSMAQTTLLPFIADYTVELGAFSGERRLQLSQQSDGDFRFDSVMRTHGIAALLHGDDVLESSLWHNDDGRVVPQQYSLQDPNKRKDRNIQISFDWNRNKARSQIDGKVISLSMPPGTQDKLGYLLSLMQDLQRGQKLVSYPVLDGDELKTYRFSIIGKESIETPYGRMETVKLRRDRESSKRDTFIWCAPSLDYLPVRIAHHTRKEGKEESVVVMSLSKLQR